MSSLYNESAVSEDDFIATIRQDFGLDFWDRDGAFSVR